MIFYYFVFGSCCCYEQKKVTVLASSSLFFQNASHGLPGTDVFFLTAARKGRSITRKRPELSLHLEILMNCTAIQKIFRLAVSTRSKHRLFLVFVPVQKPGEIQFMVYTHLLIKLGYSVSPRTDFPHGSFQRKCRSLD